MLYRRSPKDSLFFDLLFNLLWYQYNIFVFIEIPYFNWNDKFFIYYVIYITLPEVYIQAENKKNNQIFFTMVM